MSPHRRCTAACVRRAPVVSLFVSEFFQGDHVDIEREPQDPRRSPCRGDTPEMRAHFLVRVPRAGVAHIREGAKGKHRCCLRECKLGFQEQLSENVR